MSKLNEMDAASVIIPTYQDTHNLVRCLKSIYSQSYPSNKVEVIVVNNDPKEDLSSLRKQFNNLIILNQKEIGSYAARNKGIRYSKNKILAFIDSDCIPDRDWIKNAIDHFSSHKTCSILGGKVVKVFQEQNAPTVVELYDLFSFHLQQKYISKYHFAVTANLFVKKGVFGQIGFFNETFKSGGDAEFGNRAWSAGYKVCYKSDVVVRHDAIKNVKKLLGKMRRIAGGKFQRNRMSSDPFPTFLFKIIRNFFKTILNAFEIKAKVPITIFCKLISLEVIIQLVVFAEYLRLRFGFSSVRSY